MSMDAPSLPQVRALASRIAAHRSRVVLLGLSLLIVGALVLGLLSLFRADRSWQRLQEGGALRVAIDPSFPPFENTDADGQVTGFDADLAHELGRRIGAPVELKAIAFDGLVDAVIAGKVDVVVSAFPFDPRLSQDIRYSVPYFDAGLVVVTMPQLAGNMGGDAPADALTGRRVAVEWGSQGDAWAREQRLAVLRLESPQEALAAVGSGAADAAVVDAVTAALSLPAGLVVRQPALTSEPYVIVMPRGAGKLADAVDAALTDMVADGTWSRLAAAHFPSPPPPPLAPATPTPGG